MPRTSITTALLCLALLLLCAPLGSRAAPAGGGGLAAVLTIDGPIGPATSDYFRRAMRQARSDGARVVVLEMDTPGGLDTAMRSIIQAILNAPVPVIAYVAPSGARAASAGTYILYASHLAAMAPGTNLGAATPIQMGPGGGGKTEHRKVVNDAVAYIRGLAQLRGRNADWAEKAVRQAASLPAQQALKAGVVDLVAPNIATLLKRADGREVTVQGRRETLHTAGLRVVRVDPDWRARLLAVLTNPNVAYLLLLLGALGVVFEFTNPGTFLPGVAGAICLMLALYAFQILPVNYAGLGLILLGLGMMVAEAFVSSFGALGIGGTAALVIGSVILMDTDAPGFGISPALIGAVALFSVLLLAVLLGVLLRSRRRPVVSGKEGLVGAEGVALGDFAERGSVRVQGEVWSAVSAVPVRERERIRVVAREGLVLRVEPLANETGEETQ
ncbi:MAG TPA: nodulation protein NfeD [Gammaproteobacteria bacterium]|nr:nodulation protein NfeD [Gammaproteobacteria bacterium]